MTKQKLEEKFDRFLQNKHGKNYIGTDDNMPDDYEDWLSKLDIQEVIDYAIDFISQNYIPKAEVLKEIRKITDPLTEIAKYEKPTWKELEKGITKLILFEIKIQHKLNQLKN